MSFFFGKKKGHDRPQTRDGPTGSGSSRGAPTPNGVRPQGAHTPTPGGSVGNSVSTTGGHQTPSPEQIHKREGSEPDGQLQQVSERNYKLEHGPQNVYVWATGALHTHRIRLIQANISFLRSMRIDLA